ncbi:MAG: hypothetical protein IJG13_16050 [Kiritimatiellae bacterium]|nr:hypothetical protein [Kiritimatiellia bacterium]
MTHSHHARKTHWAAATVLSGFCLSAFAGFAPINPARDWKVVYGSNQGPEGRALQVLSEAAAPIMRDHGTTTSYVLAMEKAGGTHVDKKHLILVGRPDNNPALVAELGDTVVPKGGYVVKTRTVGGTNVVAIAGDTPRAVLWGAFEFADIVKPDLTDASVQWRNMAYEDVFFKLEKMPDYVYATAPETPVRSLFTWGHVIDDYRLSFREFARSRLNRVILWNEFPPVNAAEVVREAHDWGLDVFWGFAWGWSTDCRDADLSKIAEISSAIVHEWETVWGQLPGDGIYFQSFTELSSETIGGKLVAECVVDLVNDTARKIRAKRPGLPIVFGLHANSVKRRIETIEKTDKDIDILWENWGGFPVDRLIPGVIGATPDVMSPDAVPMARKILASDRRAGLVWKALLQDWTCWAHQPGPYMLGCAGVRLLDRDRKLVDGYKDVFDDKWMRMGPQVVDFFRMTRAEKNPPYEYNTVAEYNPPLAFATLAQAELFWSSKDEWKESARRIRRRMHAANVSCGR